MNHGDDDVSIPGNWSLNILCRISSGSSLFRASLKVMASLFRMMASPVPNTPISTKLNMHLLDVSHLICLHQFLHLDHDVAPNNLLQIQRPESGDLEHSVTR